MAPNSRLSVALFEARIKAKVKPILFADDARPREIRFGPGKGVQFLLSRRDGIQRELGLYETELHQIFRLAATGTKVIYDIGASDGYTTLTLANIEHGARVFSFEPDPPARALLEKNLALNPWARDRVTVLPLAAGARSETVESPDGSPSFEQASIDDLIDQGFPIPDLVKIDVDGPEGQVLNGLAKTLRGRAPLVIVETHSLALENECLATLEAAGYEVDIVKNAGWRILWPETRHIEHNRWLWARPRKTHQA